MLSPLRRLGRAFAFGPAWGQAFASLWRDLRAGELYLLMASVALAVAALSAVSLFAYRLSEALARDATALLGGDAVVVSERPIPSAIEQLAKADPRLQTLATLTLTTMARNEAGEAKLVALRAVQEGYPLRGRLMLQAPTSPQPAMGIPPRGEVWVQASLLGLLQVKLGERILLGNGTFRLTRVIDSEPDRAVGFWAFAPRVMINRADLESTALIAPTSRVTYRFAVAPRTSDDASSVAAFIARAKLLADASQSVRIDTPESGQPELKEVMALAEKFFQMVGLLTALLCACAIAIAARHFANSRLSECAIRRVLGASQRELVVQFALQFFSLGVIASFIGMALGFGVQQALVEVLSGFVNIALPGLDVIGAWRLFVFGVAVGLIVLMGFGLPSIVQLAGTPALRVLRQSSESLKQATWWTWFLGLSSLVALFLLASKDGVLGVWMTLGFFAAAAMFAAVAFGMLKILQSPVVQGLLVRAPASLRLATRQVVAHRMHSVVQVASLSMGLLALFVLFLLRTQLLDHWHQARAVDTHNRMVINILPQQAQAFRQAVLATPAVSSQGLDWYPLFRGRLIAVNAKPTSADDYTEERAKRLIEREFNLSNTAQMPAHNVLLAGEWQSNEDGAVSVEEGLAKSLHLKLGDTLTFDIAGTQSVVKITSLRRVDWQSMRANFFVLYPQQAMPQVPITYLAAFKNDLPQPYDFDNRLVRDFPNITVVDFTLMLQTLKQAFIRLSSAVQTLFGFALIAGLLVVIATAAITARHTKRDFSLMRALGASRGLLARVRWLQFAGVGALSGWIAGLAALGLTLALSHWVLQLGRGFPLATILGMPLLGALVGALFMGIVGASSSVDGLFAKRTAGSARWLGFVPLYRRLYRGLGWCARWVGLK